MSRLMTSDERCDLFDHVLSVRSSLSILQIYNTPERRVRTVWEGWTDLVSAQTINSQLFISKSVFLEKKAHFLGNNTVD